MIPVVTPEEMKAIDEAAPEPTEELVRRAGAAVARSSLRRLGGGYGRRVVVVAGKGNNGADGRAAAARLRRQGARVTVLPAGEAPEHVPPCDLVIDAAYGTGFHGEYRAPDAGGAPVLAVDIPSGVDGLTGEAGPGVAGATVTVTFAALKPGLVLGPGRRLAGAVEVADIGLDVGGARMYLVEDGDVAARLPERPTDAHKWQAAVLVVAGSPGMMGAPLLASRAAMRAGAGYVQLGVPELAVEQLPPGSEVVGVPLPGEDWAGEALRRAERAKALIVGPGLGRADGTLAAVRRLLEESPVPVVLDGDGLAAVDGRRLGSSHHILTPHDGEFEHVTGARPGPDRIGDTRAAAARTGAVVLLKGPTTVVADPGGEVLLVTSGGPRLATAGTGDVLSGVIAAFLAQGVGPRWAAALGAHVHGAAAALGPARGLVAGDVVDLVAAWLSARA